MRISLTALLLLAAFPLHAQTNWFSEARLQRPEMRKALGSLNEAAIVDEWIRLTEIPAPSGKEQARADYVRAELQKLGLTDIRADEMSNVSGVRKGTGGGPSVVFAAHLDTVFPLGTDVKVKRDGDILRAPGIGDDTGNVIALLEAFRALNRAGIKTRGDVIFLASTQEEVGLKGAKYWLTHSGYKPDLFVALDLASNEVWYGALRIDLLKFFYTAPSRHTLYSRDAASPAKALAKGVAAVYGIPLPPLAVDVGDVRLPTINIGSLGGGTVANAIPAETWFTVDLRSLDTPTHDRLRSAVIEAARRAADEEHVGFRMEHTLVTEDYSKALPKEQRLNHSLVQTAVATANFFRQPGTPAVVPLDLGSTDANIAISLGIPAVSTGTVLYSNPHQLEENAQASSIVPGIKQLITSAVVLTTH
jgi:acetylornithine deacetylase/succinyl-diaminopimelate desuccinylase-like protein